jgi:hypothetical protein
VRLQEDINGRVPGQSGTLYIATATAIIRPVTS